MTEVAADGHAVPVKDRLRIDGVVVFRWGFLKGDASENRRPGYDGAPGRTNEALVRFALDHVPCRVHIVSQQVADVYGGLSKRNELDVDRRRVRLKLVDVDRPEDMSAIPPIGTLSPDELLVVAFRQPWSERSSWWQHLAPGRFERVPGRVRHSTSEFLHQAQRAISMLGLRRIMVVAQPNQVDRIGVGFRRMGVPVSSPSRLDYLRLPYEGHSAEPWTATESISRAYEELMYLAERHGKSPVRAWGDALRSDSHRSSSASSAVRASSHNSHLGQGL